MQSSTGLGRTESVPARYAVLCCAALCCAPAAWQAILASLLITAPLPAVVLWLLLLSKGEDKMKGATAFVAAQPGSQPGGQGSPMPSACQRPRRLLPPFRLPPCRGAQERHNRTAGSETQVKGEAAGAAAPHAAGGGGSAETAAGRGRTKRKQKKGKKEGKNRRACCSRVSAAAASCPCASCSCSRRDPISASTPCGSTTATITTGITTRITTWKITWSKERMAAQNYGLN